jgi:hypothetical protein
MIVVPTSSAITVAAANPMANPMPRIRPDEGQGRDKQIKIWTKESHVPLSLART